MDFTPIPIHFHGPVEPVDFDHRQIMIFADGNQPFFDWSEADFTQGYVKDAQGLSIQTLLEDGIALVMISEQLFKEIDWYDRVIELPLKLKSNRLKIATCAESSDTSRWIELGSGNYSFTFLQRVISDDLQFFHVHVKRLNT